VSPERVVRQASNKGVPRGRIPAVRPPCGSLPVSPKGIPLRRFHQGGFDKGCPPRWAPGSVPPGSPTGASPRGFRQGFCPNGALRWGSTQRSPQVEFPQGGASKGMTQLLYRFCFRRPHKGKTKGEQCRSEANPWATPWERVMQTLSKPSSRTLPNVKQGTPNRGPIYGSPSKGPQPMAPSGRDCQADPLKEPTRGESQAMTTTVEIVKGKPCM
jgi:hypothetical protein